MARKSRKVNLIERKESPENNIKSYRSAAYIRLSVTDSGKDGDTIEDQKKIVEKYIEEEPSLIFSGLYCDNGHTGTKFARPAFDRLMTDIKLGIIDCIVVKDLSRFGRNYKEAGNYIERIFPFLGIRFIAINDNLDTLHLSNDNTGFVMPLKNLINEYYCKDLSKKIITALEYKQHKGDYIGSWAPYGYCRSEEDCHKLIIDPVTSPIIQMVFRWTLDGMTYKEIERRLNQKEVASPFKYLYQLGIMKNPKYNQSKWNSTAIKNILLNPVYTGDMVQGRHKQSFYKNKDRAVVSSSDWIVVEDTHEAIVSREDFDKVQELIKQKKEKYHSKISMYEHLKTENIFYDKICCALCGHNMTRDRQIYGKGEKKASYTFICYTHAHFNQCKPNNLPEKKLKNLLCAVLKQHIELAVKMTDVVKTINQSSFFQRQHETLSNKLVDLNLEIKRIRILRENLYQSYVDKLISKKEFINLKQQYTSEIGQAEEKITELEREKNTETIETGNLFLKEFKKFQDVSVLSREIIEALVEKIYVADGSIEIVLRYRDEYAALLSLIEKNCEVLAL